MNNIKINVKIIIMNLGLGLREAKNVVFNRVIFPISVTNFSAGWKILIYQTNNNNNMRIKNHNKGKKKNKRKSNNSTSTGELYDKKESAG
jgi:hypothetical protein